MDQPPDPKLEKTYALPRTVRAGRWWRAHREAVSFVLLGALAVGALISFLTGNPGLGTSLATFGLLYLGFGYARWFWLS